MENLGYTVEYHDESGNAATHHFSDASEALDMFGAIAGYDVTAYGFPKPEQWETLGWDAYNIEVRGYSFHRYSEEVGNTTAIISVQILHGIEDEDMAHVINKTANRYGIAPESVRVTAVTEYPGEGATVTVTYGDYREGPFGTATWGIAHNGITIYQD